MVTLDEIIVDKELTDAALTQVVLKNAIGKIPHRIVSNPQRFTEQFLSKHFMDDPVGEGKKTLLITANKGCTLVCYHYCIFCRTAYY